MKLLVAGAAEVDAGKTTFAAGLASRTGLPAYKPRAGNDYWYDHDDLRATLADGRLYGADVRRLVGASSTDARPEELNPVHRLWLPTPGRGTGLLGREGRAFAVDRVTLDGADRYLVNATVELPSILPEALPLAEATVVESFQALEDAMVNLHRPALDALAETVDQREAAVVESYADVARPLSAFVPDAVAVVEPRRCRVYDGERYARACDVTSGSAYEGRLEERVGHVVDLLEPAATTSLPALTGDERGSVGSIADAYGDAYDALLSAV